MGVCNQLLFPKEQVLFAPNIAPEVNALLQSAVHAYDDTERAESLLWQAHELDPDQLEVYIALYKFYFYKYRLDEAQQVTEQALAHAARLGGFPADWQALTPDSANWSVFDGPERIYLYSLKALGFIRLRRMDFEGGEAILNKLTELDPQDCVGGSVLLELAAGLSETTTAIRRASDG